MTNSSKADDICGVCNEIRELHGDKQHEFRIDGQLIPLKKAEPPRQSPPAHRDDPKPAQPDTQAALLRLTTVLIEKGIFDAHDVVKILGG